jgi:hypothetical protein
LLVQSFLKDFLQDRNLQDRNLAFYSKQTPLNIFKLSHFELQSQQYYLGKRYSVNKEIARNREFYGIGQEVEKSFKNQISLASLSQKSD